MVLMVLMMTNAWINICVGVVAVVVIVVVVVF
jgi:hypothetical protein